MIAFLSCLLLLAAPARAQAPDKVAELERRIDLLSQEVEKLKLGEAAEPTAEKASAGFAPAASKVYRAQPNRVSIGGYGEMIYSDFAKRKQNADTAGTKDQADFLRAVLYAGYKFNDWILFNSELEFEHGSTGKTRGEVSVEQAYVDFKVSEPLGIRTGLVLVPMGLINEVHEPTTFHGVKRPNVENSIIPSTWRENGAGVFGTAGIFSYRSFVMTGLQAVFNTFVPGFSGSSGLRDGRSSGAKSFAEDLAWASRVDVEPVAGVRTGAALYIGQADQNLTAASIPVTLWDVHGSAEFRGLELRALYAQGRIGNVDALNAAQGIAAASGNSVGSRIFGGYGEAAFNVLSLSRSTHYLAPFVRYERYDTQADTPEAWAKNPANSRVEYTFGLTYKPIPQVAVKADHQWLRNQARTGVNQFNLGLAYIF